MEIGIRRDGIAVGVALSHLSTEMYEVPDRIGRLIDDNDIDGTSTARKPCQIDSLR